MKNLLYLCLGLLIFGLIACKSEFTNDLKPTEASSRISNIEECNELLGLDRVPIYPNEFAIEELLANPDDPSDQNINYLLHTLSEAVQPLLTDCNFNSIIVDMARSSPLNAASLIALEEEAPQYYDLINENLPAGSSIERIANQLIYFNPDGSEQEEYDPGIFIPNLEIASEERQPLLSAQLLYKGDELHLENTILCSYYEGEGEFKETWVGEYVADITTNPIFVIDVLQQSAKGKQSNLNTALERNSSSVEALTCPDEYTFTNYSIAYRYESDNKSEYWYAVIFYADTGARLPGGGHRIKQIHKDDLYQWHYDPWRISQMCPDYPNTVRMAIVTFERDWYSTVKNVFLDGNQFQLNMKFSSEWYQKIVFDADGSDYSVISKGHVGLESSAICSDCPPGYSFDGAHCHAGMGAPSGYFPFIWGSSFYTAQNCGISTANYCCPNGFGYDSANCHSGITIPAGWQPFIWQGQFYVHPKCL